MSVFSVVMLKVCCSSLDRSIPFYKVLGFRAMGEPRVAGDWAGPLYGVEGAAARFVAMGRLEDPKGVQLELIEWTPSRSGAPLANAPGSGMAVFRSNDIKADCAALAAAGGRPLSEPVKVPGPERTTYLVTVSDPDGFGIQLVQFVRNPEPNAAS